MKSPRDPHPLGYVVAFVLGVLCMAAVLITVYERHGSLTERNDFSEKPANPPSLKEASDVDAIPTVDAPFLPSARPTNNPRPVGSSNQLRISGVLRSTAGAAN